MEQPDPEILVIKEYPILFWVLAAMFGGFGLFFLSASGGVVGGLIGVGVGAVCILLGSIDTITLDKRLNLFSVRHRYPLRTTYTEYSLDEVLGFEVDSSRTSKGGNVYRPAAVLKSGELVPLTSYYSSGRSGKQKRADQLSQWLGLAGSLPSGSEIGQQMRLNLGQAPTPASQVSGETDGVHWQVTQLQLGQGPITRWFSADFKMAEGFLFLAQKPKGMRIPAAGLLEGLGSKLVGQALKLYGFGPAEAPGWETARPLEPPEPRLEAHFFTLTSNPFAARQALNAWVTLPLVEWAERSPVLPASSSESSAQLVVLFSPQGVFVCGLNTQQAVEIEALTRLGVELVRAQGGR